MERHECMDNLEPTEVQVRRRGKLWEVPGLKCRVCGEEYLEPETVRSIERAEQEERARGERARRQAG
ncbi:MAG: YgiT-type zinc finger protein [Chloroflexi bacterium]|nr:YgiT-type zinc finger protein [Chloroflexota bacterium]